MSDVDPQRCAIHSLVLLDLRTLYSDVFRRLHIQLVGSLDRDCLALNGDCAVFLHVYFCFACLDGNPITGVYGQLFANLQNILYGALRPNAVTIPQAFTDRVYNSKLNASIIPSFLT